MNPEDYEQIGEERTFEVDIVPPQVFKREIVRPKYRHKTDRARPPILAPAPKKPVVGGYASAGLLAWVALSKYVDHTPLYRLERQSARWGGTIPRQTMADWIRITAEWLEPIYRQMHRRLLRGSYLQADDYPKERIIRSPRIRRRRKREIASDNHRASRNPKRRESLALVLARGRDAGRSSSSRQSCLMLRSAST